MKLSSRLSGPHAGLDQRLCSPPKVQVGRIVAAERTQSRDVMYPDHLSGYRDQALGPHPLDDAVRVNRRQRHRVAELFLRKRDLKRLAFYPPHR